MAKYTYLPTYLLTRSLNEAFLLIAKSFSNRASPPLCFSQLLLLGDLQVDAILDK